MSSWSVEPPDLGRAGREEKDVGRRQDISTLATTTAAAAAGTGASIHTHTHTDTYTGPILCHGFTDVSPVVRTFPLLAATAAEHHRRRSL